MHKNSGLAAALLGASMMAVTANDIGTIAWSRGPDVPLPRGGYGLAWYHHGLVLAGGTFWRDSKKYWTDDVSFFNPTSKQWSRRMPLPRPLAYGALVECRGSLYLLGGCDDRQVHRDLLRSTDGEWIRIGEIPEPRVYSAAGALDGRIYLTAGSLNINDLTTGTQKTWIYDTRSGKWSEGPSIPGPPRLLHALAAAGDSLYVFGGCAQKPGGPLLNLDDAYRLDAGSNEWKSIKSLPMAIRAAGIAVAKGSIYLFGGHSGKFLDQVYRYDLRKNDYTLVSRLAVPLADTKFAFGDGCFFGPTGEDAGGSRFPGLLIGRLN